MLRSQRPQKPRDQRKQKKPQSRIDPQTRFKPRGGLLFTVDDGAGWVQRLWFPEEYADRAYFTLLAQYPARKEVGGK